MSGSIEFAGDQFILYQDQSSLPVKPKQHEETGSVAKKESEPYLIHDANILQFYALPD